jgi:hypothetical protein
LRSVSYADPIFGKPVHEIVPGSDRNGLQNGVDNHANFDAEASMEKQRVFSTVTILQVAGLQSLSPNTARPTS